MTHLRDLYLPVSFRRGGRDDKYGIWFSLIAGHCDLLVDPGALSRYLPEGNPWELFLDQEETGDGGWLPFIADLKVDQDMDHGEITWNALTDRNDVLVYHFDAGIYRARILDCIAALYRHRVLMGQDTAYGDKLDIAAAGRAMLAAAHGANPCCRETAVPALMTEEFSCGFSETDMECPYGDEKRIAVTLGIGARTVSFEAERNSFLFEELRHDLENFMYHGKAQLRIFPAEEACGMEYFLITVDKCRILDETIPITRGTNGRYRTVVYVSVEKVEFDQKSTLLVGFCEPVPMLGGLYNMLRGIVGHYEAHKPVCDDDVAPVRREDFLSARFVQYLEKEKKGFDYDEEDIRKHYAFAGHEIEAALKEKAALRDASMEEEAS